VSSKVSLGSKEFSARLEIRCSWGRGLSGEAKFGRRRKQEERFRVGEKTSIIPCFTTLFTALFPASRLLASIGSDVGGKGSLIGIKEEQNKREER
jgi:hypothetical protein